MPYLTLPCYLIFSFIQLLNLFLFAFVLTQYSPTGVMVNVSRNNLVLCV